jgi:hypothetical protein
MKTFTRTPLGQLSDQDLLAHVQLAVRAERHATARVVALLMELDARRLYLEEGCSSLFTYCTHVLHLSEHAAYNRIETARASRRFPMILELLENGDVTLTAVRLLAPQLTPDNHRDVLKRARHKSKREIELLVATLHPKPDVPSVIRKLPDPRPSPAMQERMAIPRETPTPRPAEMTPLTPERYKIQVTVSRETYLKLRHAQDLLRHSVPDGDPAVILERALTLLVAQLERAKTGATERPRTAGRPNTASRHIPAAIKRKVWQRDAGRCAFKGPEGRCRETSFLEYHHVVPFAAGGQTTDRNIELRCRAHNLYEAERYFGPAQLPIMREERAVFGTSPRLVPERAAPDLGRFLFVADQRNPTNGACDNRFGLSVELHAEPDVDAVQLQETAAHRCAREMHAGVHGKKSPAAHENFGAPAVHDDDFVNGVACLDEEGLRIVDLGNLETIRPIEIAPGVEIGCCRTNNAAH